MNELTSKEERYLTTLKELHRILEYTDRINMSNFVRSNNLNRNISVVLQNGGIISNAGGKSTSARYKWTSIPPNMAMVKKIIDECTKISLEYNEKSKAKRMKTQPQPQPQTQTQTVDEVKKCEMLVNSTTRLLFGLIKIKTTYKYN
jgi:hypothetical protein